MMKIVKPIIAISLLLLFLQGFSQKSLVVGNDTINRLDARYLKQGKWVFYNANKQPQVMCAFKNDTIVGKRIFMIDSGKVLVRESQKDGKENFLYVNKGAKIKGWFDVKGNIFFENPLDSVKKDSSLNYWYGVPALYAFGQKNINEEIDALLKPYISQIKGNKLVIEFLINRSGISEMISVKMEKSNEKLEQKIRSLLLNIDRWQPAFNGWKIEPYKKQIVVVY